MLVLDTITNALQSRRSNKISEIKAETDRLQAATLLESRISYASNYNSGGYGFGTSMTSGQKYPGGLSASGMRRVFDHHKTRRNIRDAMYDSVEGRGMATRFADTIADTGLKAKLEPDTQILGITADAAEEWSKKVSAGFDMFMSSKSSSLDGHNNGYQNQWLYAFSQQRDNDMYVRLSYSDDPELISPIQLQFIDPDQISGYGYTSTDGAAPILNTGINYNDRGQEISYDIVTWVGKEWKKVTVPRKAPGGRIMMLHGFRPEYAGQRQGYALYTHLLQEFEDVTSLKQAHIQKAINQSSWVFYTKPSKDAPSSSGIGDMANAAVGPVADFMQASAIDGLSLDELNAFTANIVPEFSNRQPGSLWNMSMQGGEDMKAVEQTAPADKFAEYVESVVSSMASSAGMPIEVLLMKFGQNYSASRATLVLFWRIVNMWRAEMEADFLNPLLEMWISEEIAAGRISAPGWSDPRLRAAWSKCRWIGSQVPNIDPKKEAEACAIRATLGAETLEDIALGFNGSDAEANRAKLRQEIPGLAVGPWNGPNYQHRPGAIDGNSDFTESAGDEDDE